MAWRNVPPFASGEAPRNPATPHGATQQMELIPVVNHVDVSSRKFAVSAPFYGGLSDRLIPYRPKITHHCQRSLYGVPIARFHLVASSPSWQWSVCSTFCLFSAWAGKAPYL